MRQRWVQALAALGVAVGGGGCATSQTTSAPASSSGSSAVGLGTVPGSASGSAGSASGSAGSASGSAGSASATASSTGSGRASSADLLASRGYGSYELCQGQCTGRVPPSLQRPVHLPPLNGGPCPVTVRPDGPLTPSSSTEVGFQSITGSPWLAAEVTWTAAGSYSGPVLIRGGELGGGGALGFGEGRTPYDALQLLDSGRVSPRVPAGGRAWTTYTRIRQAGCYAYQVDGTNFTETIVFRAVG